MSAANHVSVSQLKDWNKLKSNVIRVGQILYGAEIIFLKNYIT
ncbi:LysM peptidoglycan-binding domain-containing protein [Bacillus sp. FJAT-49711]